MLSLPRVPARQGPPAASVLRLLGALAGLASLAVASSAEAQAGGAASERQQGFSIAVVPLVHADAQDLVDEILKLAASSGLEGVRITADAPTNSLVISALERDQAAVRRLIEAHDQPLDQILIEATLLMAPSAAVVGGDALGLVRRRDVWERRITLGRATIPVAGPVSDEVRRALGDMDAANAPEILATPLLLLKSGEPVGLHLGRSGLSSRPLPSLPAAGMPTCAGPERPPGRRFVLSLTPQISGDGRRVRISLVTATGRTAPDDPGRLACVWRTSKTMVETGDHESFAVESLTREREVETSKRLPVLGSVPLLGDLFQTTERRTERAMVFWVLTPHIIRSRQDLRALFEHRMQERQEHLDHALLFGPHGHSSPRVTARSRGLLEEIRQSQRGAR